MQAENNITKMNEEITRLSRLTAIITLLQSQKIMSASRIAEKFNVSKRTIYRDIRTLENAGIPIVTEERKGYSIMDGYSLSPLMFTEQEANTLITVEKLISRNNDSGLIENYSNIILKIKALLKNSEKDKIEILSSRIGFSENKKNNITSNTLVQIQTAITNHNLIQLKYSSHLNEVTNRTVESYGIYLANDNWILVAWCQLRNDFREFRLDRIQDLKALSHKFEERKFNLTEYFVKVSENFSYHS